jgi:hypothetical protein
MERKRLIVHSGKGAAETAQYRYEEGEKSGSFYF